MHEIMPWKVIEVTGLASDQKSRWNDLRCLTLLAVLVSVSGSVRMEWLFLELE